MYHALFLVDFLILVLLAYKISIITRLPSFLYHIIFGWVIFHATLVVTGYMLSTFSWLYLPGAWLSFHVFLLTLSYFIPSQKNIKISSIQHSFLNSPKTAILKDKLKKIPAELYLLILFYFFAFAAIFYLNFFTHIQMDADSLDYHLPRAYYYLQQGSFSAFPTPDIRQTNFPFIMELEIAWIFSFIKELNYFFILQWCNNFIACLCIYLICRHIHVNKICSVFVAMLWISLPIVIIQSVIVKNDLLISTCSIVAFSFVLLSNQHFYASAIAIGLSLGLAIGTKYNALFISLTMILITIHYLLKTYSFKKTIPFITILVSSIVVIGSYNYIDTYLRTGSPFAQFPHVGGEFRPYFLLINFLRLIVELTDSVVAWGEMLHKFFGLDIPDFRLHFFKLLGMVPFLNIFDSTNMYSNSAKPYYEFGYSKYYFSLGVTILLLIGCIHAIKQRNHTAIKYIFVTSFSTFIIQASLINWQLSNIRLYLPMLSILFPFIGLSLSWIKNYRMLFIPILLSCIFSIGVITQFYFFHRIMPLQNRNPQSLLLEWINPNKRDKEVIDFINNYPSEFGVALKAHSINYEALLAGMKFDRFIFRMDSHIHSENVIDFFSDHPKIRIIITKKGIKLPQSECVIHPFKHGNLCAIVKNG